MAIDIIETVKIEPGKVTSLLSEHPVADWAIYGIKDVIQKWVMQRGHQESPPRIFEPGEDR